ncbi:MAG TPA: hypothetical protein VFI65_14555 [Streptosporangiaceae bacterium]|nr:hypothetical protein [Streptosporangiaceae bacterium]
MTFLDRRTLRTSRHEVTVHPFDVPAVPRTQDELRHHLGRLLGHPPLAGKELADRWQRLSDDRFGAFAELDDTRVRQLPLKVTLARMSDPCGLLSAPATIAGAGADSHGARDRAIRTALATYAAAVIDPRLLVDGNDQVLGPAETDASRLLRSVRAGEVEAFVRAVDLSSGQDRLLPMRQAFPVLGTQGPFQAPCGASAASNWRRALTDGLLQHCARLTVLANIDSAVSGRQSADRTALANIDSTVSGPQSADHTALANIDSMVSGPHSADRTVGDSPLAAGPSATLAIDAFEHEPTVRFLAAMVKAAGLRLTLRDITGPAQVPVVAGTADSMAAVYGAGAGLADAVIQALTAALFRYQRQRDPVLRAAVPEAASPEIWTAPAGSDGLSPDRLVRNLAALGYSPCVFALDHDRAVYDTFPFLLQVTC